MLGPSDPAAELVEVSQSETIGPIDYILVQTGLVTAQTAPQWLGDPNLTLPAIAMMENTEQE